MNSYRNITVVRQLAMSGPKTSGIRRGWLSSGCVFDSKAHKSYGGQTLDVNLDHPDAGR